MGASNSIHPINIKSVDVSFLDKNTGKWLSESEINGLNQKVFREFDYSPFHYEGYKTDKFGNNPYDKYAKELQANKKKVERI